MTFDACPFPPVFETECWAATFRIQWIIESFARRCILVIKWRLGQCTEIFFEETGIESKWLFACLGWYIIIEQELTTSRRILCNISYRIFGIPSWPSHMHVVCRAQLNIHGTEGVYSVELRTPINIRVVLPHPREEVGMWKFRRGRRVLSFLVLLWRADGSESPQNLARPRPMVYQVHRV